MVSFGKILISKYFFNLIQSIKYFHLDNNEEESEEKENDLILQGINGIMSEIKEMKGRLEKIEGNINPKK